MVRIVFGVIAGFLGWLVAWVGSEVLLAAISPDLYGVHQAAFQAAIENGGPFTADTTMLLVQVVLGAIVSLLAGFLAATVAGGNRRASLVLGVLLVAMGLLKAAMSWAYVPLWYHLFFTALLLPMAVAGGRLCTDGAITSTRDRRASAMDTK